MLNAIASNDMRKPVSIVCLLLLASCAGRYHNDFDQAKDFTRKIDDGLWFIREVTPGIFRPDDDRARKNWKKKASELCQGSGYKSLLLEGGQARFTAFNVFFAGGLPTVLPEERSRPVVDGVVLCGSSPLTEQRAIQILKDKMYILPQQS